MQKIIAGFAVTLSFILAGCNSTPTNGQAGAKLEDRTTALGKPMASINSSAIVVKDKVAAGTVPPRDSMPKPLSPTTRSIYFDYDSDVVKEEFRPSVAAHAHYLMLYRTKRIIVQGNTDQRGSREYNLALGQRRADSVKNLMIGLGAHGSQIKTVSFGKEKPRAQVSEEDAENQREAAYADNRRADILYWSE